MQHLFWTGYYRGSRQEGIAALQEAVRPFGDIVDFGFFSDVSAALVIEIPEKNLLLMAGSLDTVLSVERPTPATSDSVRERTVYLNVHFTESTGDLRIEVPAVPG